MGLSFKPEHLKRYKDIAWLLWKYGRSDWVKQIGLERVLDDSRVELDPAEDNLAEQLADDLEKLGPTFIKLGQLLASRADLLPPIYLEALSRLQDRVEPFPFEEVEKIITQELPFRFSRGFSEFDPTPIAAASLGQVHRAALRDGRTVVIKVQRPDIRERIESDFDSFTELAEFLDRHTEYGKRHEFQRQLAELRKAIWDELDYRLEASNLTTLSENLKGFTNLVIPKPTSDYTTSRVLTMDYLQGASVKSISPVVFTEIDATALCEELFQAYLKQVLIDGFFHGDPHPGNILITSDHKLALLDLGQVGRLTPGLQQDLLKLLLAISEGRGEDAADVAIAFGEPSASFNRAGFKQQVVGIVARHQDTNVEQLQTGRIVLEIQKMAGDTGIRLPQPLTMIGKMLMNLDQVARLLDPSFNPNASIRNNSLSMMRQRMTQNFSLGNLFQTALETTEFVQHLPKRVNAVLDTLANKEFKLNVNAIDEEYLLKGIHKVANRITTGLVVASLIIGAALLMRVETKFTIMGYPGFAMIMFTAAFSLAAVLLIQIMLQDHRHEEEVRTTSRNQKQRTGRR